jgi:phenylalanine-4-hydroxylase
MTTATNPADFEAVARRHGVDLGAVQPESFTSRMERLEVMLADQRVPFPVDPGRAVTCLRSARAGEPFAVGGLNAETVDLGHYANQQHYDRYSTEEHLSWACLVADQQRTKHRYACREYLAGEQTFEIGGTVIPDYWLLNTRIYQQTGWQLATVSEIIPAELFFTCHSRRFFPVTTFMRKLEQDYLEEPDIGHDVAGHVATFTIPAVANVMKNHGLARDMVYAERDQRLAQTSSAAEQERIRAWADELLLYAGRIYWFTVEFGLVMQAGEIRDFGAGILSSPGETVFSIDSVQPNRILIDPADDRDLLRLATTDYLISEFQKTYFVMKSFDRLDTLTPERILRAAKQAVRLPHYTWRELVPGDRVLNVGRGVQSPNEKYWQLMAGQPVDDCLFRAAVRNLRLFQRDLDPSVNLDDTWSAPMPPVPAAVRDWFVKTDHPGHFPALKVPLADADLARN